MFKGPAAYAISLIENSRVDQRESWKVFLRNLILSSAADQIKGLMFCFLCFVPFGNTTFFASVFPCHRFYPIETPGTPFPAV